MLLIPLANLPPVSLIPAAILPPASLIPVVHLVLRIFKKFETVLMGYSGAGGKLTHEKTRSKKYHDTVPLNITKEIFRLTVPPEVLLLNYMTIKRDCPKLGFSQGIIYILVSLISPEGSAKLRWEGLGRAAPRFAFC